MPPSPTASVAVERCMRIIPTSWSCRWATSGCISTRDASRRPRTSQTWARTRSEAPKRRRLSNLSARTHVDLTALRSSSGCRSKWTAVVRLSDDDDPRPPNPDEGSPPRRSATGPTSAPRGYGRRGRDLGLVRPLHRRLLLAGGRNPVLKGRSRDRFGALEASGERSNSSLCSR
jgi:hypothetical protein